MNCLSYNCRGLGNPAAFGALKGIIDEKDPDVVFLSETKLKGKETKSIKRRLRYTNKIFVDCRGDGRRRSGGLAFFWKTHLDLSLQSFSQNHIDMVKVGLNGEIEWKITGVYGYPDEEDRHKTWELLRGLKEDMSPWLCFEDFIVILEASEKEGGAEVNDNMLREFHNTMNLCGLEDIGYEGHRFTWSNNQGGEKNIQQRLDRFLENDKWRALFPWQRVTHLTKRKSDHQPIFYEGSMAKLARTYIKELRKRPCRFEKAWTREKDCEQKVAEEWEASGGSSNDARLLRCC